MDYSNRKNRRHHQHRPLFQAAARLALSIAVVLSCCRRLWNTGGSPSRITRHQGSSGSGTVIIDEPQRQQQRDELLWWKESPILPPWLKEYAEWHRAQIASLTPENWRSRKYLVAFRCLRRFREDDQCGGAADRLAGTPIKLYYAAKWKRIVLMDWDRPARLEDFLVPPATGLNWTVPDFIKPHLTYDGNTSIDMSATEPSLRAASVSNKTFVFSRDSWTRDRGAWEYNTELRRRQRRGGNESTYEQLYRQAWDLMFEPVKPIRDLIEETMLQNGLVDNEYDAVHIRSRYRFDEAKPELIEPAVDCGLSFAASRSTSTGKNATSSSSLYVATDSRQATAMALRAAKSKAPLRRAGALLLPNSSKNRTLLRHLDRGTEFLAKQSKDEYGNPAAYYDTFVDLYLLRGSRCIAYGRGSFGQWANWLSKDPDCHVHFFNQQRHRHEFPPSCSSS